MYLPSFKVGKAWGIPIKVDILLIGILVLIAWGSRREGAAGLASAHLFILTIGLLISIVLHELGHSLIAIRKGCRVRQIVLTIIGGVAQMEEMPRKPRDEFVMALMGPLVSIAVGLVCWFGGEWIPAMEEGGSAVPLVGYLPWRNMVQHLGVLNFMLAGFNLLPAFPMDGGRLLRAMLTPKYGRLRATYVAARLGRILATLLGTYGIFKLSSTGSFQQNVTLILIAIFVYIFAGNEYRQVRQQETSGDSDPSARPPPPPPDAPPDDNDDQVSISPPPYRKGPNSRSPIRPDNRHDFFQNLFD
jgi:Zn-dependent protease